MKKVYYASVRYRAVIEIVYPNGDSEWVGQELCDLTDAKRIYLSFKDAKGCPVHKVSKNGSIVFHEHTPYGINGICGGIVIQEIRPIYFE